jgi:hypothetical protein
MYRGRKEVEPESDFEFQLKVRVIELDHLAAIMTKERIRVRQHNSPLVTYNE